ncbi:hypothetical protein D3C81_1685340 [compost metagenome]
MNKHIPFVVWMYRDHADVRAINRTINHFRFAIMNIDAFNGFTGKRRAGRTDVKNQPLAVRRPGLGVSELMMAGGKSDLFHKGTLMRVGRIRV